CDQGCPSGPVKGIRPPAVIWRKARSPSCTPALFAGTSKAPEKSMYRMGSHAAGPLLRLPQRAAVGFCGARHCPSDAPINPNGRQVPASGEQMASNTASSLTPTRDDFAAMLDESFGGGNLQESSVIKGKVVAIEKDMAVIDVGLKTEGRVALREFAGPGRESDLKVGDEVEVFLDRIENALGEAVLSRDKARREESWGKLEKAFNNN